MIEREGNAGEPVVEVISNQIVGIAQRHGLAVDDSQLMPIGGAINRFIEAAIGPS